MQISRADDIGGQRGAGSTLSSGKGKEKVATSGSIRKAGIDQTDCPLREEEEADSQRRVLHLKAHVGGGGAGGPRHGCR
jgi:hypothetical protein